VPAERGFNPAIRYNHFPHAMESLAETAARILDIEARQDDALSQLAALERRIEQVLAQHLPPVIAGPSDALQSARSAA
jgi:hypothetical protein